MEESILLSKIRKKISFCNGYNGIGDDCAILDLHTHKKKTLVSCDVLVDHVHFDSSKQDPFDIGYKCLAVNLSDIASMAGTPLFAVISCVIPPHIEENFIDRLYDGVIKIANDFSLKIVGGDLSRSLTDFSISLTILGEENEKGSLKRSGARVGDSIFVTGLLGGSLKGKHLSFTPRLKESHYLYSKFKITSMIDLSDGLAKDIRQVLSESQCGAVLYKKNIPLSKDVDQRNPILSAMTDGEDFELLFTVPESEYEKITLDHYFKQDRIYYIGKIVEQKGLFWKNPDDSLDEIKLRGYEHNFFKT